MATHSQASAPLGWPAQVGLVLGGALAVISSLSPPIRIRLHPSWPRHFFLCSWATAEAGSAISAGMLKTWRDVPASAVRLAVVIGVLAVLAAGALRTVTDPGWAAVAIFIGAAMIIDCLVRMGATRAQIWELAISLSNARRLEP